MHLAYPLYLYGNWVSCAFCCCGHICHNTGTVLSHNTADNISVIWSVCSMSCLLCYAVSRSSGSSTHGPQIKSQHINCHQSSLYIMSWISCHHTRLATHSVAGSHRESAAGRRTVSVNLLLRWKLKALTYLIEVVNVCLLVLINVKKLQFNQVLTATCIEWHIENSKNDKKVILAIITSLKRQCDAE